MKNIKSIRFGNKEETLVLIEFDDGSIDSQPYGNGVRYRYSDLLDEWKTDEKVILKWKTDDELLELAKEDKKAEIEKSAEDAEHAGFISEALEVDVPRYYESDDKAQRDLIGVVALSGNQAIKCSVDKKIWEYKIHTPEQRQNLIDDGGIQRFAIAYKRNLLIEQINTATAATINNIIWE